MNLPNARPVLLTAALLVIGCDLASRDPGTEESSPGDGGPSGDAGADGDTDADTDSDSDADALDGGPGDGGPDASWRTEDAGETWDDGHVSVDGPCDGDCFYLYKLDYRGWGNRGKSYFRIQPGQGSELDARGVESVSFLTFFTHDQATHSYCYQRYSQELLVDLTLDDETLDLRSGEARIAKNFGEAVVLAKHLFDFDADKGELTHIVDRGGVLFESKIETAEAPLVMFNLDEYPFDTHGNHSSLLAHLMRARYDDTAGGAQQIPVFAPESGRLTTVEVERVDGFDDRLVIRYPQASSRAFSESLGGEEAVDEMNQVPIDFEHGIPVEIGTRDLIPWILSGGPTFELSVPMMTDSTSTPGPTLPGTYETSSISIASGGISLAGEIDDPDGAGPHPVVILIPGFDHRTRRGELGAVDLHTQLGALLANQGYLVLRTDARGNGESGGDLSTATVDDLADDVEEMAAALGDVAEADSSSVYLFATGLGVHVAAAAARRPGSSLDGLILHAPFARSLADSAGEAHGHYLSHAGFTGGTCDDATFDSNVQAREELIEALADGGIDPGSTWRGHTPAAWQSILGLDLVADPTGVEPVLIVVGEEDHLVPPEMGVDLYDAMDTTGLDATLEELEGVTHGLTEGTAAGLWPEHGPWEEIAEDAVDAVVGWLDARTGGAK